MEDLATLIGNLESDTHREYVLARSEVTTDKEGYIRSGITKTSFYAWPRETRDYLNELARKLRVSIALKAKMILGNNLEKAALVKVEGLDNRDARIKQSASTEILDRMLGKPKQAIEHTGEGGRPIQIVEIIKAGDGTLQDN